jgi:E3 ubiquitin-protein ligase RBBP6
MESARCPQPKIPSPTLSAASMGEQKPIPVNEETPKIQDTADEGKAAIAPQQTAERARFAKVADMSEATHESMSVKEPAASQGSAPLAEEEVQQRVAINEAGNVLFNGLLVTLIYFFFASSQCILSRLLLRYLSPWISYILFFI